MERAREPCLEPRLVLDFIAGKATGPVRSSGSDCPCRSELCCCNTSAWGLLPSSVSPADVSGSRADGVQPFRAIIHSLDPGH